MKKYFMILIMAVLMAAAVGCKKHIGVVMKTSMGDMEIELFEDTSPETAKNFLLYVDNKFYDGTTFHRVISNFMIQGGGFTTDMTEKDTESPIISEAANGLQNKRGTIAMARTQDMHSATSQFFINVVDNHFLDHGQQGYGYCVFGQVTKGMEVADRIREVQTHSIGMYRDVPVEPVVIHSIRRKQ